MATGHLNGPEITAGGRTFTVGDRVVTRRNDRHLGVRNGTLGTITAVHTDTGALQVRTDQEDELALPADYVGSFVDHAYALTVHAAQGATVDQAFVLASDASRLAEWGYVALSRARTHTRIYVLDAPETRQPSVVEPALPGPSIDDFADALARPTTEPLATDQLHSTGRELGIDL
ncbi:MAG: ATP-binding domain-containing protein [Thermoleophilia bacterium]